MKNEIVEREVPWGKIAFWKNQETHGRIELTADAPLEITGFENLRCE